MGQSDTSGETFERAKAEVVEWNEFCQGYNEKGECVICICGMPYPHRWDHYCPYDDYDRDEEFQW